MLSSMSSSLRTLKCQLKRIFHSHLTKIVMSLLSGQKTGTKRSMNIKSFTHSNTISSWPSLKSAHSRMLQKYITILNQLDIIKYQRKICFEFNKIFCHISKKWRTSVRKIKSGKFNRYRWKDKLMSKGCKRKLKGKCFCRRNRMRRETSRRKGSPWSNLGSNSGNNHHSRAAIEIQIQSHHRDSQDLVDITTTQNHAVLTVATEKVAAQVNPRVVIIGIENHHATTRVARETKMEIGATTEVMLAEVVTELIPP